MLSLAICTIKCLTSRCSITPALRACVGQFLSRAFVVLLRKSNPQNHNLKTAAELGVKSLAFMVRFSFAKYLNFIATRFGATRKRGV